MLMSAPKLSLSRLESRVVPGISSKMRQKAPRRRSGLVVESRALVPCLEMLELLDIKRSDGVCWHGSS